MNVLKEFGNIYSFAYDFLIRKVNEQKEIILIDRESEDDLPDEFYELPTQHLHRKYHIEFFHIWKLSLNSDGAVVAHGYDTDSDVDYTFLVEDSRLSWDTVIDLVNLIDEEPDRRSYVILTSDNEWLSTGNLETDGEIAATIAECKERRPDAELIIYYSTDSEVIK